MSTKMDELFQGGAGWADYHDNASGSITVSSGTWQMVPSDGDGAKTDLTNLPPTVPNFWDTADGHLLFAGIPDGARLQVECDVVVTPSTSNQQVWFRIAAYDPTDGVTLLWSVPAGGATGRNSTDAFDAYASRLLMIGTGVRDGETTNHVHLEISSDSSFSFVPYRIRVERRD